MHDSDDSEGLGWEVRPFTGADGSEYQIADAEFEIRQDDDGPEGRIKGFASRFNKRDSYGDTILPGAFASATRKRGKLPMLWQHDTRNPVGGWDVLKERDGGLWIEGQLELEVRQAQEARVLAKAGVVTGLSIGFITKESEPDKAGRKIKAVDLWEVSLVTFPALPSARVAEVKNLTIAEMVQQHAGDLDNVRSVETALRDVGFSQRIAKALTSRWRELTEGSQRDVDPEDETAARTVGDLMKLLTGDSSNG